MHVLQSHLAHGVFVGGGLWLISWRGCINFSFGRTFVYAFVSDMDATVSNRVGVRSRNAWQRTALGVLCDSAVMKLRWRAHRRATYTANCSRGSGIRSDVGPDNVTDSVAPTPLGQSLDLYGVSCFGFCCFGSRRLGFRRSTRWAAIPNH